MSAEPETGSTEKVLLLEANLDDLNPEIVGYVLEQALEAGALDAYTTAVQMKKNRPGVLLSILARPGQREAMVRLLTRETSTLGVRIQTIERVVLPRRHETVETRYGTIRIKIGGSGSEINAAPEYEDCRAAALQSNVPLKRIYQEALAVWREMASGD